MGSAASVSAPAIWAPAPAVRVRGTIALLAEAGEGAGVYERFGARLAADGYVVGAFAADDADAALSWFSDAEVAPRVLAGSDRGAVAALRAAVDAAGIDALLLAGLPVTGVDDATADDDAQRTACPVHLGVLRASARSGSGAPPLAVPDAAALGGIRVPVLAIHGGADPIAPFAVARETLAPIPVLEFVETVGGLHDALNDQSHRSVAATIVLWLERLRAGGVDAPIVRTVIA